MNEERSDYIFKLADESGIPCETGRQDILEDKTYLSFRDSFLKWSERRDAALKSHLTKTSTLFRVFLPYSSRVFRVASQVVWYIDELVVQAQ
jgi:hypothetical protein